MFKNVHPTNPIFQESFSSVFLSSCDLCFPIESEKKRVWPIVSQVNHSCHCEFSCSKKKWWRFQLWNSALSRNAHWMPRFGAVAVQKGHLNRSRPKVSFLGWTSWDLCLESIFEIFTYQLAIVTQVSALQPIALEVVPIYGWHEPANHSCFMVKSTWTCLGWSLS